jgi:hypothetical protein
VITTTAYDWALDAILELDFLFPSLAGAYLRASNERRQVMCAYLAARKPDAEISVDAAELLLLGTHAEILRAAYGSVPTGIRRALARSGPVACGQDFYGLLYDVLSRPEHAKVVPLVQRLPTLTATKLKIALMLPADLRHPRLVTCMDHVEQASDLITVTNLMEHAGLDRSDFVRALTASGVTSMSNVVERWTLRLPFPPSPLPACNAYQPIHSGSELRRAALRYRNCSRSYLADALAGNTAFGEFHVNGEAVLVHLDKRDGMWLYCSSHGFRNRAVAQSVGEAAQEYAARYGIFAKPLRSRKAEGLKALQRLGGMPRSW